MEIAVTMLLVYMPSLLRGRAGGRSLRRALAVLAGSTAPIGWISEILVGSVDAAAKSLGMSG